MHRVDRAWLCHQEGPCPHPPPKPARGWALQPSLALTGAPSFQVVLQERCDPAGAGRGAVTPSAVSLSKRQAAGLRGVPCSLPPAGTDPAAALGPRCSPILSPSCQALPGVLKAPWVSASDGAGQRCWGPSPGAMAGVAAGCACAKTCQGTEGEESPSCGSPVFLNK